MGAMAEALAKVKAGEMNSNYLREKYNEHLKEMIEINDAVIRHGPMGAKDKLAGSTEAEKEADFIQRTKELEDTADWIRMGEERKTQVSEAQAAFARLNQLPGPATTMSDALGEHNLYPGTKSELLDYHLGVRKDVPTPKGLGLRTCLLYTSPSPRD